MDASRFVAVLSFVLLLAPLAGLAEDNAGSVAAKIVEMSRDLRKKGKEEAADKLLRDAAAECEAQIERKPDDASARFGLAQLQVHLDQVPAAAANLDRALQLEPNNAALHAFKGKMYGVAKEWRKSIVPLRRAVELEPTNAGYRMMLAMGLGNIDEHEEAVAQAHEALKLQPNEPGAVQYYALILLQAGKYGEWEQVVRSALARNPKDNDLREMLMVGLVAQQRYEKAYRECLELQKLNPQVVEIEAKLILYATLARQWVAADQHVAQMLMYRATGKYDLDDVIRDQFYLGKRTVHVREAIEAPEETFNKFVFYVVDELEKEECRVQFTTSDRINEQLRRAGKLKETERVYYLMSKRGNDVQHFGAFPQPTYEQARALAIEIIEGTRLPNAPSATVEKSTPERR